MLLILYSSDFIHASAISELAPMQYFDGNERHDNSTDFVNNFMCDDDDEGFFSARQKFASNGMRAEWTTTWAESIATKNTTNKSCQYYFRSAHDNSYTFRKRWKSLNREA